MREKHSQIRAYILNAMILKDSTFHKYNSFKQGQFYRKACLDDNIIKII